MFEDKLIVVRGAGDIATGTINKLYKSGMKLVCLEVAKPSAIRRTVAYSECVYNGQMTIENTTSVLAKNIDEIATIHSENKIPVIIDEKCELLAQLNPDVLVDAIIAKKNLGTKIDMARLTIALGPGFEAGVDVDYVIETMRGHNLGKVIESGYAIKNTGTPGVIAGKSRERVIHSPASGVMRNISKIGDIVKKDDVIAKIDDVDVLASMDGLLRGLLRDGYNVPKGMKIADIDPRLEEYENCFTISDKAKSIAGGVLEAILMSNFGEKLQRNMLK